MKSTIKDWVRSSAFIFLSSLLVVTASERVYWYLGGIGFEPIFVIALFYAIPMVVGLWVMGSGGSNRLHQMILSGAIFGFVVEGVLTPVIYEDGPLPVLAAMFVAWHGLLSVVSFWYLARKWLLERRFMALAIGATLVGAYWGAWSIIYRLPDALDDFEETFAVMEPAEFAGYAVAVGAVFAAAHYLIGFVWPEEFKPGKWGRRTIVILTLGYAALAVMPFVPWAPLKFGVLVGGALWLLRRSRENAPGEPSAIAELQGTVALQHVTILMIAPVVAAVVYAGVWSLGLSDDVVQGMLAFFSGTQVVAGLIVFIWAGRRALRPSRAVVHGEEAALARPSSDGS